jgi:hypothetical protein
MSVTVSSARIGLAAAFVASLVGACATEHPTVVKGSPLSGLQRVEADSGGGPPPDSAGSPAPDPTSPGYVHGTVLGPSAPGSGNDSLSTAPRIAGVVVTAISRVAPTASDTIGIGSAVATVTTGADGRFQLPTLPGGEYFVTFVPPANSGYGGVWVSGTINARSSEWAWWVVLWKK